MSSKLSISFYIFTFCMIYGSAIEINPEINFVDLEETPYAFADKDCINVVAFIDATCDPCEAFAGVWNALPSYVRALGNKLKINIVDCTIKKQLCLDFGVKHTPTIRYFSPHSNRLHHGQDLPPGLQVVDNLDIIINTIKDDSKVRTLGIDSKVLDDVRNQNIIEPPPLKNKTSSHAPDEYPPAEVCIKPVEGFQALTLVQSINPYNIQHRLYGQPRVILVGFYDMICPPSKLFVDNWNQLAFEYRDFRDKIIFAAVDCRTATEICARFFISSCPSIQYIPEYLQNGVGIPISTNIDRHVMMQSVFEVIRFQQRNGRAKQYGNLAPYKESDITGKFLTGTSILLLDDKHTSSIGPKVVLRYTKHYIRYAERNEALYRKFNIAPSPTLVILKNGQTIRPPIPINTDINDIIRTIENNVLHL